MRRIGRSLMTSAVVTLYGGIALVGYGLHELSPAHQHGTAAGQAHVHSHGSCTHHSHHPHAPIPDRPGWSDSHECDICSFLAQARSEPPQLATVDLWQPSSEEVASARSQPSLETFRGLHIARGPPLRLS